MSISELRDSKELTKVSHLKMILKNPTVSEHMQFQATVICAEQEAKASLDTGIQTKPLTWWLGPTLISPWVLFSLLRYKGKTTM